MALALVWGSVGQLYRRLCWPLEKAAYYIMLAPALYCHCCYLQISQKAPTSHACEGGERRLKHTMLMLSVPAALGVCARHVPSYYSRIGMVVSEAIACFSGFLLEVRIKETIGHTDAAVC